MAQAVRHDAARAEFQLGATPPPIDAALIELGAGLHRPADRLDPEALSVRVDGTVHHPFAAVQLRLRE